MFGLGKNKKDKEVEKPAEAPVVETKSDDALRAEQRNKVLQDLYAVKSKYTDCARTSAVMTGAGDKAIISFFRAQKLSADTDTNEVWRVISIEIRKVLDTVGPVVKPVLEASSFYDAMNVLSKHERQLEAVDASNVDEENAFSKVPDEDMAKLDYLKRDFSDTPYFKSIVYAHGMVPDRTGQLHPRQYGTIVTEGFFDPDEIVKANTVEEKTGITIPRNIEKGVLTDMFNLYAANTSNLDERLERYLTLAEIDAYAVNMVQVYCAMKSFTGEKVTVDGTLSPWKNLGGETLEGVKKVVESFKRIDEVQAYDKTLGLLQDSMSKLERLKAKNVYVEPFEKFLAECETALYMMAAMKTTNTLSARIGARNEEKVAQIKQLVTQAEQKFRGLGASDTEVDILTSCISKSGKINVPPRVAGFIDDYFMHRNELTAKLEKTSEHSPNKKGRMQIFL